MFECMIIITAVLVSRSKGKCYWRHEKEMLFLKELVLVRQIPWGLCVRWKRL